MKTQYETRFVYSKRVASIKIDCSDQTSAERDRRLSIIYVEKIISQKALKSTGPKKFRFLFSISLIIHQF